jgi:hypothetical protein
MLRTEGFITRSLFKDLVAWFFSNKLQTKGHTTFFSPIFYHAARFNPKKCDMEL